MILLEQGKRRAILIILLVTLLLPWKGWGFGILDFYPQSNTEFFTAGDTLRILFDSSPRIPDGFDALYVRSDRKIYNTGDRPFFFTVRGDTLEILPYWAWVAGEKVRVTITEQMQSAAGMPMDSAFTFEFSVKPTHGIRDSLDINNDYTFGLEGHVIRSFTTANLNNDLFPDLIVLYTDTIGVALNQGPRNAAVFNNGGFNWFDDTMPPCDGPRCVRAADLDRDFDHRIDIVSSDYWRNTLTIHRNTSSFQDPTDIRFARAPGIQVDAARPIDFVLADLDNDGLAEIAVITAGADQLIIFHNVSTPGNMSFLRLPPIDLQYGPKQLLDRDLDNDGRVDLAICYSGTNEIDVLWNNTVDHEFAFELATVAVLEGQTGADGIALFNDMEYWDDGENPDREKNAQYPDLLVWSEGNFELDEGDFVYKLQNSSYYTPEFRTFNIEIPLNLDQPFQFVFGDLDGENAVPGKNMIMTRIERGQDDAGLYSWADDGINFLHYDLPFTMPVLSEPVDIDLDGDLDLLVNEISPGEEHLTLLINPDFSLQLEQDTLDFVEAVEPSFFNPTRATPIDSTSLLDYLFINSIQYPVIIDTMYILAGIPNLDSIFTMEDTLQDGITPFQPEYDIRVAPEDTLHIPIRFAPSDTANETGVDTWERWHGFAVLEFRDHPLDTELFVINLLGSGARSELFLPITIRDFSHEFDMVPGDTMSMPFYVRNRGNYWLHAGYNTGNLSQFTLVDEAGQPEDSIRPYAEISRSIRFLAPDILNDTTFVETLMVYDLREWQPNTLDSAMLELRARVINNELPVFDFPPDTAFEGFTHILCGDVFDPNSPDDSVECWLADVEGDINYLGNISDLNPAFRTRICPEIFVPEGVLDWHGETLTLIFAAVDRNINIDPSLTEVPIRLEIVPDTPESFHLLAPPDSSVQHVITPVLVWEGSSDSDAGDGVTYNLIYSVEDPTFVSPDTVFGIIDSSYTFAGDDLLTALRKKGHRERTGFATSPSNRSRIRFPGDQRKSKLEAVLPDQSQIYWYVLAADSNTAGTRSIPNPFDPENPYSWSFFVDTLGQRYCDQEAFQLRFYDNYNQPVARRGYLDTVNVTYTVREIAGIAVEDPFYVIVKRLSEGSVLDTIIRDYYDGMTPMDFVRQTRPVPMSIMGINEFVLSFERDFWWDINSDNDTLRQDFEVYGCDLSAERLVVQDQNQQEIHSAAKSEEVNILWMVEELNGAYPQYPTRILLQQDIAGGQSVTFLDSTIDLFPHQGIMQGMIPFQFQYAGLYSFRLTVDQVGGSDDNPDNDRLTRTVEVRMPDLSVDLQLSRQEVHLLDTLHIYTSIRETKGVSLAATCWFRLTDTVGGETRNLAADTLLPVPFPGGSEITGDYLLLSDRAGTHLITLTVFPGENDDASALNNRITRTFLHTYQGFRVYPRPFTPNGDSYNDYLYFSFEDDHFANPGIHIFQVNGEKIISLSTVVNNAIVWDGRNQKGETCLPGVYLYVLEDGGKKARSGMIYLAR